MNTSATPLLQQPLAHYAISRIVILVMFNKTESSVLLVEFLQQQAYVNFASPICTQGGDYLHVCCPLENLEDLLTT